jgi:hypothetical protein
LTWTGATGRHGGIAPGLREVKMAGEDVAATRGTRPQRAGGV